jgi:hypothetical protein
MKAAAGPLIAEGTAAASCPVRHAQAAQTAELARTIEYVEAVPACAWLDRKERLAWGRHSAQASTAPVQASTSMITAAPPAQIEP